MTAVIPETVDTALDTNNRHGRGHQDLRARLTLDERRAIVSDLVLAHHTAIDIARQLGISRPTVYDDIKVVHSRWQERHAQKYDAWISEETAKLDSVEAVLIPAAQDGDYAAIDRLIRLWERRAKLLGLDAPYRAEVEVTEHRSTVDEAIEQLHAQIEAKHAIDVESSVNGQ